MNTETDHPPDLPWRQTVAAWRAAYLIVLRHVPLERRPCAVAEAMSETVREADDARHFSGR